MHELVGDRPAELGGDVVVAADLVDVVGERRPVEQLAVEVAGDQARGRRGSRPRRRAADEDGHECQRPHPRARLGAEHSGVEAQRSPSLT